MEIDEIFSKVKKVNPNKDLWFCIEQKLKNSERKKQKQNHYLAIAASVILLVSVMQFITITKKELYKSTELQENNFISEPINNNLYE